MRTYIYTLSDPNTSEVRYIGKTINLHKRYIQHLSNDTKTHCRCWIQTLKNKNLLPIMEVIDEVDSNGDELEKFWIAQFKEWGFNLTNHTEGGEGQYGRKASIETKIKMSKYRKENPLIFTNEIRNKISLANKNKFKTKETIDKISNSLKEYHRTNVSPLKGRKTYTKNNKLNSTQVLEIRGLLLKGYSTLNIANRFNISKSTIEQIKSGKTWQSIGEFKLNKKASRLSPDLINQLYEMFNDNLTIKQIQNKINICVATIYKQRKLWKHDLTTR